VVGKKDSSERITDNRKRKKGGLAASFFCWWAGDIFRGGWLRACDRWDGLRGYQGFLGCGRGEKFSVGMGLLGGGRGGGRGGRGALRRRRRGCGGGPLACLLEAGATVEDWVGRGARLAIAKRVRYWGGIYFGATFSTRSFMARLSGVCSLSRPAATPRRSAEVRFWLVFHLPSMRRMGTSMPTIPFRTDRM
jgi:hypothetical protein